MSGKKWNIEQKNYLPDIKTPDSLNRFRECRKLTSSIPAPATGWDDDPEGIGSAFPVGWRQPSYKVKRKLEFESKLSVVIPRN
jgi:hypothetical protein